MFISTVERQEHCQSHNCDIVMTKKRKELSRCCNSFFLSHISYEQKTIKKILIMSKIRNEKIVVMDSIEATKAKMPHYNAFAYGTGKWMSKKHPSRAKQKQDFRKEVW